MRYNSLAWKLQHNHILQCIALSLGLLALPVLAEIVEPDDDAGRSINARPELSAETGNHGTGLIAQDKSAITPNREPIQ